MSIISVSEHGLWNVSDTIRRRAPATPEHDEKALAGSEPRDIALAVWQRLAIQAARLKPEDLGRTAHLELASAPDSDMYSTHANIDKARRLLDYRPSVE